MKRARPSRRACAWLLLAASTLAVGPALSAGRELGPQLRFASAEAAAEALGAAYAANDPDGIAAILGDAGYRLVASGDPIIDRLERSWFLSLYREGHEVVEEAGDRAVLQLGENEQPFPIPIVGGDGEWQFDPQDGHEDLLSRRISKAELTALNLVVAYLEAQRAYHEEDHDGDGVREYARRIRSAPGRRDGLWWNDGESVAAGPIAGLIEAALDEGYRPTPDDQLPVYRGYAYKVLDAQGAQAPGGARRYLVDGEMTGGFALVAFPVRYGVSGILTFMVSQDGVVYQKDLGADTVGQAAKMTTFDPDPSWDAGAAN